MISPLQKFARALALLAICFQIAMPGAMAATQSGGIDAARYICAPSESAISDDAKAAAVQIAALLGEDTPEGTFSSGHCDACTLGQSAALPVPAVTPAAPIFYTHAQAYAPYALGFAYNSQGPPTVSRGPPTLT